MPIYEFNCGECGALFEELVPVGTEAAACPSCGRDGASRRLSPNDESRQPTAAQKRRMEDRRGIDRDGARRRFKRDLARNRERKPGS